MVVSDVIQLARSVELNQLAIKDDKDAIISFLNLGLLELHKRFDIIQEAAIITMKDGVHGYKLNGSDSNVEVDSDTYELIKICEVHDCKGELPINNRNRSNSVGTPRYNTVEVPCEVLKHGEKLTVIYRASPKFNLNEKDTFDLPPQMLEALLHYIGYRGHTSISGNMQEENNTHYLRFDKSCEKLEEEGLLLFDDLESTKFKDRGFV